MQPLREHHLNTIMHKIIGQGNNYYKLTHQTTTNEATSLSQIGLNTLKVGFPYFKLRVLLIIGFNHN